MKITTKLWIGIALLAVISPLGWILPAYFKAGGAWGEEKRLTLWRAPMSDYSFGAQETKGLFPYSFATIISAISGIIVIVTVIWILGRILAKKGDQGV